MSSAKLALSNLPSKKGNAVKDYDAYLFDLDGTLARTIEVWITELHEHALAYGLLVTYADTARHFGDLKWVVRYGLPPEKLDAYLQETLDIVLPQLPGVPLYNGAIDVLRGLKKREKKLALVTTSLHKVVQSVMRHHPALHGIFDTIIAADDVATHKPDPEGINLILSRLQIRKDKALMLGDTGKDIEAAHNAGIDSLLYYPKSHQAVYDLEHLQSFGPTYTVHSWPEFLRTL